MSIKKVLIIITEILLGILLGIVLLNFLYTIDLDKMLIIILGTLSLIGITYITWHSSGYMFFPSPLTIFNLFAVIIFIGSFILLWQGLSVAKKAVLTISISLITLSIGIEYANILTKFKPYQEIRYYLQRPIEKEGFTRQFLIGIFLGLISIAGSFFYYQGIPPVLKSFEFFFKGYDLSFVQKYVSTMRTELTKGHLFLEIPYRGQGILRLFWLIILPFIASFYIYNYYILKRKKWRNVGFFFGFFSIIFLIGTGERSHIFLIGIIFLCGNLYIRGVWLFKKIIFWSIIGVSFYIILTLLLGRKGEFFDPMNLFTDVLYRIFLGQAIETVEVFYFIPKYHEYYYGKIIWEKLIELIPGPSGTPSFAYQLAQFKGAGSRSLTYASNSFFSTTYADFGTIGTIMISFCVGFLLQYVTIKIVRFKVKTVSSICMLAFLSGYIGETLSLGTIVSPLEFVVTIIIMYFLLSQHIYGKK